MTNAKSKFKLAKSLMGSVSSAFGQRGETTTYQETEDPNEKLLLEHIPSVASDEQPQATAPRSGSKLSLIVEMLNRPSGTSLNELTTATGWLPHTTRATLTGLRKRGFLIERHRTDDGRSIYRLASQSEQDVAA